MSRMLRWERVSSEGLSHAADRAHANELSSWLPLFSHCPHALRKPTVRNPGNSQGQQQGLSLVQRQAGLQVELGQDALAGDCLADQARSKAKLGHPAGPRAGAAERRILQGLEQDNQGSDAASAGCTAGSNQQ